MYREHSLVTFLTHLAEVTYHQQIEIVYIQYPRSVFRLYLYSVELLRVLAGLAVQVNDYVGMITTGTWFADYDLFFLSMLLLISFIRY